MEMSKGEVKTPPLCHPGGGTKSFIFLRAGARLTSPLARSLYFFSRVRSIPKGGERENEILASHPKGSGTARL
jgi:hypothetical protein